MDRLEALLSAVIPVDDKERADLALMQAQLGLLPAPLSRGQPSAHFTGSAVVSDGTRVALVHHRKLGLTHSDGLDDNHVIAKGVEQFDNLARRAAESAMHSTS